MKRQTLLDVLYKSFYFILCIALFVLLLITPGDAIKQALANHQLYNIFVIAGGFALTILLAVSIYAQRLFTNNNVLKAIPKTWIPVEKGDVNKKVRKMIVASLNRSAIIAWEARPRIPEAEESPAITSVPEPHVMLNTLETEEKVKEGLYRKAQSQIIGGDVVVTIPPQSQWRSIAHEGWSSPLSPDLPNLQYSTVILELPHLIEARAVSLAPPNLESPTDPTLPDIRAMGVLQRPTAMGLREYIGHLTNLGVIENSSTTASFLASYEFARFSGRPLTEPRFRDLMKLFADLLRMMNGLNPAVLASLDIDPPESDIDEDGSTTSTPRSRSLVSSRNHSIRDESEGTVRTVPSRNTGVDGTPTKHCEKFSTAPATPRSKKPVVSRTTSLSSFSHSKRPYTAASGSSNSSLRSASQSTLIKLSRSDQSRDLPYTLTVPGTRHN